MTALQRLRKMTAELKENHSTRDLHSECKERVGYAEGKGGPYRGEEQNLR